VIYFDTCALLKLIRADTDSAALGAFIDARPETRWFTSELARAELARTIRRLNHDDQGKLIDGQRLRAELGYAESLWERLDLIAVSTRVLVDAGKIEQPFLRTLDAIHRTAAASMGRSLASFVAYDKKLAAAAREAGLPALSPG